MSHTPGPWNVGVSLDYTYGRSWPVFRLEFHADPNPGGQEVQATRRLMEAAPELLEALQAVRAFDNNGPSWHQTMRKVDLAIAKATGKEAP